MLFIKNYIKGLMKEISLSEEQIQQRVDVLVKERIDEIMDTPNFKPALKKYIRQKPKEERTVWDILASEEIRDISLTFRYYDENNMERKWTADLSDIKDLNQYVHNSAKDVMQSDAKYIKSISMYVRYYYKEQSESMSFNFMGYRGGDYDIDSIDKVFKEIREWINKYPEHLL